MSQDVEKTKARTEKKLRSFGLDGEIDLDYITAELLDYYRDTKSKRDKGIAVFPNISTYYGNSLVHDTGSYWYYLNGNASDGSDDPSYKCLTTYRWRARLSRYSYNPCRNNTPPGGFDGDP